MPKMVGRAGAVFWLLLAVAMPLGPAGGASGDLWRIEGAGAALRAAPRDGAAEVMRIDAGHRLIEYARRGAWLKVGVFQEIGGEGWIPAAAVVPAERPDPQARIAALAPPPETAPVPGLGPRFDLLIEGSPGLKFSGSCRLVDGEGMAHRTPISGLVPKRLAFRAAALSCRVRKDDVFGRLEAKLLEAGREVAEAGTSAPFNGVDVRSEGPWGPARGKRGRIGLVRSAPQPPADPPPRLSIPGNRNARPLAPRGALTRLREPSQGRRRPHRVRKSGRETPLEARAGIEPACKDLQSSG